MVIKSEEENQWQSHVIMFTEKRWYNFLWEYIKCLPRVFNVFIASAISLWAIAKVIMTVTNNSVSIYYFAGPVFLFALVVSMYKAYSIQKEYVPEPLKSESEKTKIIYRKQKCGWNAAITRQMLIERIQKAEAILERINRGSEFIEPREMSYDDYIIWMRTRPEMLQRLVQAVTMLCTHDLPLRLINIESEKELSYLRNEIIALANLYEFAMNCEIECHEIIPPEEFKEVHEKSYGWTDTIREGVRQFIDILNEIANIDRKQIKAGTVSPPSFEIVFDAPENVNEFNKRLSQLSKKVGHFT